MSKKLIIVIIIGTLMALLGLLWFLQGSNLIHVKPILCFADCEPITGKSPQWQFVGAITLIISTAVVCACLRRISHQRKT